MQRPRRLRRFPLVTCTRFRVSPGRPRSFVSLSAYLFARLLLIRATKPAANNKQQTRERASRRQRCKLSMHYRCTRGCSTNEGYVPRLSSFARPLLPTSPPPTSLSRSYAFRRGHCLSLDGQSVHTLTNDSRHSRATPPRRAILGGVLAHAAGVLHSGRSCFLPVHIDAASDTWKVSKGTSLRGCGRTRGRRVGTCAARESARLIANAALPRIISRLSNYCCKCRALLLLSL